MKNPVFQNSGFFSVMQPIVYVDMTGPSVGNCAWGAVQFVKGVKNGERALIMTYMGNMVKLYMFSGVMVFTDSKK